MVEEDTITEAAEKAANGASSPDKGAQAVTEKKEVESEGVKAMDEDKKIEADKMDEDPKVEEKEDSKERKENGEVVEKKVDTKSEAMDIENAAKEEIELQEKKEEKLEQEADEPNEEEEKIEEGAKKARKKHGRRKGSAANLKDKKNEEKAKKIEPRTPASDRPVRERRTVERLVTSIEKESVKELQIEKGRGTPLKNIPNVAFKLSKRKTDDTLKLLHTILFGGRRGKAFQIKSNVARFSGFVWHENEEKQKTKIKEKLDKCNKAKLLEFCDLLDIPNAKNTARKEDIIAKLIDFLVAPHATTDILLAEKESSKGTKRKRAGKHGSSTSGGARLVKSRKGNDSSKREKSAPDTEDGSEEENEETDEENDNDVKGKSEDEASEHSESREKNNSEDESEDNRGKRKQSLKSSASKKKESAAKANTEKATVLKKSSSSPKKAPRIFSAKRTKIVDDNDKNVKATSRKNKKEHVIKETEKTNAKSKASTPSKAASKQRAAKNVAMGKKKTEVEDAKPTDAELRPTDAELRDAICEILKEVDFNTATFTDILKQLAKRFDMDLMPRKQSIKLMIQEELTKLADEDDEDEEDDGDGDGDDDGNGDGRKEETKGDGEGAEA